jgi:hypothetical protein
MKNNIQLLTPIERIVLVLLYGLFGRTLLSRKGVAQILYRWVNQIHKIEKEALKKTKTNFKIIPLRRK